MELWQILLGIAFLFAVLTFAYLLIGRLRRREKVIKILKEAKAMKKEIEKGGVNINLFLQRKALPTTFLPSVKTLTKNSSIVFLLAQVFFL